MSVTAIGKGPIIMDRKNVSISSKRQITIPRKFFTALGFEGEAECILRGNELVLRPVRANSGGAFAEQILAELIEQGLSGSELLESFKRRQAQVRPAVETMIARAEEAALGSGEYSTYEDVFGGEDEV